MTQAILLVVVVFQTPGDQEELGVVVCQGLDLRFVGPCQAYGVAVLLSGDTFRDQ